jgi:hypothetical protein
VEIKSDKFPGMLVATVILSQVGDADTKQELRDYSFQQDGKLATETYVQAQKSWELDRPRKQERHVQHPIERKNGSSNTTKSSSGFQHSVKYEFSFSREEDFGRGTKSCGFLLWVDFTSDKKRSGRARVACSEQLEMV